jgi:hypothetical protein
MNNKKHYFSWAGSNRDLQMLLHARDNAKRSQFKPIEWRHAITLLIITIIILSIA